MSHVRPQLAALALCSVAALTGCQVVTGSTQSAQVRFIEVSSDAPAVDLYQNSSAILYGVGFGTASSYFSVTPGSYVYSVNIAGLHQKLISAPATLNAGSQYTVLLGNTTGSMQMAVLKDQVPPASTGPIAVRFLHQATRAGAVDLYLVPAGGSLTAATAVASNVTFGNAPTYLRAPSGTFSLIALPAGTDPASSPIPLYTGSLSNYAPGAARTIVLYDQPSVDLPGLQVLTAPDVEPAG